MANQQIVEIDLTLFIYHIDLTSSTEQWKWCCSKLVHTIADPRLWRQKEDLDGWITSIFAQTQLTKDCETQSFIKGMRIRFQYDLSLVIKTVSYSISKPDFLNPC
jgi:hypothetical protein